MGLVRVGVDALLQGLFVGRRYVWHWWLQLSETCCESPPNKRMHRTRRDRRALADGSEHHALATVGEGAPLERKMLGRLGGGGLTMTERESAWHNTAIAKEGGSR